MGRFRRGLAGLLALSRRRRLDHELDEELQAYLDAAVDAGLGAGLSEAEAQRQARMRVGSVEAVKAHTRDAGWETALDRAWRDLRYAARTLRKSPGFTCVAVLTLALGIGANTAIFSALNAIVLRVLPVPRPHELVAIEATYRSGVEPVFSYEGYRALAGDGAAVVDAFAASTARREAIAIDGPPEAVGVKWVSSNYFSVLGIPTDAGRGLVGGDVRPNASPVAILSEAFWTSRFGRDPAVIGRSFRLRSATFTIVGVARRGFSGESPGEAVDVWMPIESLPGAPAWLWTGHSTTWLRILARLRPETSIERARAALEPSYQRLRTEIASGAEGREYRASVLESRLLVTPASRGSSPLRHNLTAPLVVLMAVVGLVLLVACANLANLMLARAAVRQREAAVCLALGAGRAGVVRQRLTETLLLAAAGGAVGWFLAAWAVPQLDALLADVLPVTLDLSPDTRVLGFTLAVSVLTALLCGTLPALRAARVAPVAALRSGGVSGSGRRARGRSLVVVQIAVSLVLLVGAGHFVRSLIALHRIDIGFDPDRVMLIRLAPPPDDVPRTPEERRRLYDALLQRAESVPGVVAASAAATGIFGRNTWRNAIRIEDRVRTDGPTPRSLVNAVTPGYFDVVHLTVLRGRSFSSGDREPAPRVAVASLAFARRFLADGPELGARVLLCNSDPCGPADPARTVEIVGIVEDAKYTDLREDATPMLYVPLAQVERSPIEVQVRTAGFTPGLTASLHRALADGDSRVAVVAMVDAGTQVATSIVAERLVALLSSVFGLLALALATVGLYGLTAYVTSQRAGEFGIRMALGASGRSVRALVLRDTLVLIGLGALLGIPAAVAGARLLSSQFYGIGPGDPVSLIGALAALAGAALLAAYIPAWQASRLDPARALRAE